MKSINLKRTLPLFLAFVSCTFLSVSCQKGNSWISGKSVTPVGDVISKGVCTAFNVTSDSSQMCYVEDEDTYYIDYFCNGNGSFGFKWDKSTNAITIIEYETGLLNGFYPIVFLSQADYEAELGEDALPSYYSSSEDKFFFNILFQTATSNDEIFRGTDSITYQPKRE